MTPNQPPTVSQSVRGRILWVDSRDRYERELMRLDIGYSETVYIATNEDALRYRSEGLEGKRVYAHYDVDDRLLRSRGFDA